MNAAFYAGLPRCILPAERIGYALRRGSRPPRLQCQWVADPVSGQPIAVWTAEDDYFISLAQPNFVDDEA